MAAAAASPRVRPVVYITLNKDYDIKTRERLVEIDNTKKFGCNIIITLRTAMFSEKKQDAEKIHKLVSKYNKYVNTHKDFTIPLLKLVHSLDDESSDTRGIAKRTKVSEATMAGLSLDLSLSSDEFKEKTTTFLATKDAAERSSITDDIGTPDGSVCVCRTSALPCFCVSTEGYLPWLSAALEKPESFTYKPVSVEYIDFNDTQHCVREAMQRLSYKCEMPTCEKQIPVLRLIGLLNQALPGKANKTKRLAIEDKMEQMLVVVMTKQFPYAFGYCKNDGCERSKSGKPFIARTTFPRDSIKKHRVLCPDCKEPTCTVCRSKTYHEGRPCPGPYDAADEMDDATREAIFADSIRCPGCRHAVSKTEACDHMECKCGTHFCYRCAQKLNPRDPYRHTCPDGLAGRQDPAFRDFDLPPEAALPAAPVAAAAAAAAAAPAAAPAYAAVAALPARVAPAAARAERPIPPEMAELIARWNVRPVGAWEHRRVRRFQEDGHDIGPEPFSDSDDDDADHQLAHR